MAYNKKTWLARLGQGLNKFSIDGATPVPIINQPDSVTQQGDALSAGNLNDLEQRIADAFDDVEESKADKSTTDALQSQINQQEARLDQHESRLENLEQKAGDYSIVQYRGTNAVPTGKASYGLVEKIVGKTRAWNQLVDTDTSSVTLISGHKYLTVINGSFSIVTGAGTAISVTGGTDCVYDLTLIFGSGNEPSTVADALAQLPALGQYNAYNAGSLVSTTVEGVESRDSSNNVIDTLSLPSVTLRSAGSVADELDVESGVITRKLAEVDLGDYTWVYSNTDSSGLYRWEIANLLTGNDRVGVCSRYPFNDTTNHNNGVEEMLWHGGYKNLIFFTTTNYANASAVKTAMTGVKLCYVPSTAPSPDTLSPIPDNTILTEGGGTINTIQTQTPVIDNCLDVGYLAV